MLSLGHVPEKSTYQELIDALMAAGRHDRAQHWARMNGTGTDMRSTLDALLTVEYSHIIQGLTVQSNVASVQILICDMLETGTRPDMTTLTNLCRCVSPEKHAELFSWFCEKLKQYNMDKDILVGGDAAHGNHLPRMALHGNPELNPQRVDSPAVLVMSF